MSSPESERRRHPRAGPLRRLYLAVKYRAFRRERHERDGRRGLIMLQIDALAYSDMRRAMELGYCPTIARLLREEEFELRRWFCGLPSATPYCQAGIFHGENGGIPAFRFYDKPARRVITCNAPHGVQYIRDRIHSPGALAGGSSYVNLIDGDASTVAFTVATRERLSVYRRLGGTRMALLIALHPIRVIRMVFQAAQEWLREEWERFHGELARRTTHAEGIFPFIRILSNVVVRELQTMAIMLDVHLGVPVIYSTFMQYDELAHHFGPSSKQALGDLKRTDARIAEIWRMARDGSSRAYDIVILSDHGMTPSASYRVLFGESLGVTVRRILEGDPIRIDGEPLHAIDSFSDDSEYADIGPGIMEAAAQMAAAERSWLARRLRRGRDWLRSRYGLRELILPEKYHVAAAHQVVVTYSSCLALVYFADDERQLELGDILRDRRRAHLYGMLLAHPGVGLVATREGEGIAVEGASGRALVRDGILTVVTGSNPLEVYGHEPHVLRAVEELVLQPNAGDLVLFGAYDGYDIVSFDDQVGAHGSAGGDQCYPFIVSPAELGLAGETLENARDIHRTVLMRYARTIIGAAMLGSAMSAVSPPGALGAQEVPVGTIRATVQSAITAAPVARAAVVAVGTGRGASTDDAGVAVVTGVPAGTVTVRARSLGFQDRDTVIVVPAGGTVALTLRLTVAPLTLDAVVTIAAPPERERFDEGKSFGIVSLSGRALSSVPAVGERDVLRTVQLMPGVVARSDFSAGYNVRGGESDQNLVLLDGIPIYNPFHLGGLFGTFLEPTVGEVEMMLGGFPAPYGGRLSSILDVRTAREERSGIHGTVGASLLASSAALSGAVHGTGTSWSVAGRRTYADVLARRFSDEVLPYHFQDGQAHLTQRIPLEGTLSITGYAGLDVMDGSIAQLGEAPVGGGDFFFDWGNRVIGATASWPIGPVRVVTRPRGPATARGELIQRLSLSRFATHLDLGDGSISFANSIRETRLSGSLTLPQGAHTPAVGYEISSHALRYDVGSPQSDITFFSMRQNPTAFSLWIDDEWRPSPELLLRLGLRGETVTGTGWWGASPRFAATWYASPDVALSLSGGRYAQWVHGLRNEDIPVRIFDFWVASDEHIDVARADHLVAGVERWFGSKQMVRLETFVKRYGQLVEANPADDPDVRGDEFLHVHGTSYGFDVLLRQLESEVLSGWIAYTYGVSARTRGDDRFYPGQDRRHNLNAIASWRLGRRTTASGRFGFGTGTPFTDIEGQMVRRTYDPATQTWISTDHPQRVEYVGGRRNAARYPVFHRLDLSLAWQYTMRGASITPYIQVVNAYNRRNVFIYTFDYTGNPPTRQATSQFPFLPSIGITVEF